MAGTPPKFSHRFRTGQISTHIDPTNRYPARSSPIRLLDLRCPESVGNPLVHWGIAASLALLTTTRAKQNTARRANHPNFPFQQSTMEPTPGAGCDQIFAEITADALCRVRSSGFSRSGRVTVHKRKSGGRPRRPRQSAPSFPAGR
jgi:hypothetical protein